MYTIGFCGMSHLGICYSTAAAEKGFKITCFDFDENKINNLKNNNIEIEEPDLKELIDKNKSNLIYTNDILALSSCDFVYFSFDVDTNNKGDSDSKLLTKKLEKLISNLDKNIPLIILSQVPPGLTRNLYKIKKKLYYQVETLIFGNAMHRSLNPERFIVGSKDSTDILPKNITHFLNTFHCPILIMRFESAELAKIAINCYLASSLSITNTLSEICDSIGASWDEIIPTLQSDKRIGEFAYLKPGLGISGGNIERDLVTIKAIGLKKKTNIKCINSIIELSKYSKQWLFRNIQKHINKNINLKIAILGLAYKENTNSIKNSPSIELLNKIKSSSIKVYDPLVTRINIEGVIMTKSIDDAIKNSDILVIATAWEEFRSLDLRLIKSQMNSNIIIDPYKILNEESLKKLDFIYYSIG
ncbi:MAG: nucleotide sugar dehydrogenase [Pelagibacterales bacterium]|jgi:UDPglucose 6-dehydrogenase|nr:nucleotide sugar dehydrogenase [Pelagibacterales bacterium]